MTKGSQFLHQTQVAEDKNSLLSHNAESVILVPEQVGM